MQLGRTANEWILNKQIIVALKKLQFEMSVGNLVGNNDYVV